MFFTTDPYLFDDFVDLDSDAPLGLQQAPREEQMDSSPVSPPVELLTAIAGSSTSGLPKTRKNKRFSPVQNAGLGRAFGFLRPGSYGFMVKNWVARNSIATITISLFA